MADDFITIGGIRYDSSQVKGYERLEGNRFQVTLIDGSVFMYHKQQRIGTDDNKIPTILGQNLEKNAKGIKQIDINDCYLISANGTEDNDLYILNNSNINIIDISGDKQNEDTIILNPGSRYRKAYGDPNDHVVDNSKMDIKS